MPDFSLGLGVRLGYRMRARPRVWAVTPESNPGTPVIEFSIDIALQRAAWDRRWSLPPSGRAPHL